MNDYYTLEETNEFRFSPVLRKLNFNFINQVTLTFRVRPDFRKIKI